MQNEYNRKIFTAKLWIKDTLRLFYKVPTIVGAMRSKHMSKAFMEKIMLVVTAVNGCPYCEWFHAKVAMSSGLGQEEIKNMLNLQFQAHTSDYEIMALLYAQHYAETDRNPDPEMTRRLTEFYGEETAKHILMAIQMIFYGNLAGNTFDAFISRLKGKKAPNSNVLFEAIFFILHAPFLLPIVPRMNKGES